MCESWSCKLFNLWIILCTWLEPGLIIKSTTVPNLSTWWGRENVQGECVLQSLTFYGIEKVSYMFLLLENSMCIRYYVLEFLPSFQKKKKNLMFHFWEPPNGGVCVLLLSVLKRVSRLPPEIFFFILCYVINTSLDLDNLTMLAMHRSSLKIELYIRCGFL